MIFLLFLEDVVLHFCNLKRPQIKRSMVFGVYFYNRTPQPQPQYNVFQEKHHNTIFLSNASQFFVLPQFYYKIGVITRKKLPQPNHNQNPLKVNTTTTKNFTSLNSYRCHGHFFRLKVLLSFSLINKLIKS